MHKNSFFSLALFLYTKIASPKQRRRFWLLSVANVIMGMSELAVAGGISLLGLALAAPESLKKFFVLDTALNWGFLESASFQLRAVATVLSIVVLATIVKNFFSGIVTWRQNYFSQDIACACVTILFKKILYAPYSWHMDQSTATLLQCFFWRGQIYGFVGAILALITQLIILIFLLVGAILIAKLPALMLFVIIGVVGIGLQIYTKKYMYTIGKKVQEDDIFCTNITHQALRSIQEIIIYDRRQAFFTSYNDVQPRLKDRIALLNIFSPLPMWILESIGMIQLFIIFLFLLLSGHSTVSTVGILMLLSSTAWRLLPCVNKVVGAVLTAKTVLPQVERVLLEIDACPASHALSYREIKPFRHELRFNNISYAYPGMQANALSQISFCIKNGDSIGIVGSSGAGKSTLLNVLCGLVRPTHGDLYVDGQALDIESQRLHIGYVPQQIHLLNASLAENIAFSRLGEPMDEDGVLRCCAKAAVDFFDQLPNGIHTHLGENGIRLSGGQIQRVGIARALYDEPDILVFDEATSALDSATERSIQETVNNLKSSVTMVIVAHRLSTIKKCDYIYWIADGRIKLCGTVEDVLPVYEAFQAENFS